jgi:hypothetical protein
MPELRRTGTLRDESRAFLRWSGGLALASPLVRAPYRDFGHTETAPRDAITGDAFPALSQCRSTRPVTSERPSRGSRVRGRGRDLHFTVVECAPTGPSPPEYRSSDGRSASLPRPLLRYTGPLARTVPRSTGPRDPASRRVVVRNSGTPEVRRGRTYRCRVRRVRTTPPELRYSGGEGHTMPRASPPVLRDTPQTRLPEHSGIPEYRTTGRFFVMTGWSK